MEEKLYQASYRELCLQLINDERDRMSTALAAFILSGKEPFMEFLKIAKTVKQLDVYNHHVVAYFDDPEVKHFNKWIQDPQSVVFDLLFKHVRHVRLEIRCDQSFKTLSIVLGKCKALESVILNNDCNVIAGPKRIRESRLRLDFIKCFNILSPFLTEMQKNNLIWCSGFFSPDPKQSIIGLETPEDLATLLELEDMQREELIIHLNMNLFSKFLEIRRSCFGKITKVSVMLNALPKRVEDSANWVAAVVDKIRDIFPNVKAVVVGAGKLSFVNLLHFRPNEDKVAEPSAEEVQAPVFYLQERFKDWSFDGFKLVIILELDYNIISGNDDGLFEHHMAKLKDSIDSYQRKLEEHTSNLSFKKFVFVNPQFEIIASFWLRKSVL